MKGDRSMNKLCPSGTERLDDNMDDRLYDNADGRMDDKVDGNGLPCGSSNI